MDTLLRKSVGLFFWTLGVIGLVVIQVGFISSLPFPLNSINLLVALVVYRTVTRGVQKTLPWAVAAGLLYDLYAAWGFGVSAWCFLLVAILVSTCARHIVTNRSFFSLLALGVIGCLMYAAASVLVIWLYQIFSITVWSWSRVSAWEWMAGQVTDIFAVVLLLALLYIGFHRTVWDATTLDGVKGR